MNPFKILSIFFLLFEDLMRPFNSKNSNVFFLNFVYSVDRSLNKKNPQGGFFSPRIYYIYLIFDFIYI